MLKKCWPNKCWLKGTHLWWRDFKYSLEPDTHPLPAFQAVRFTPTLQRRADSHISYIPRSLKSLAPFDLFSFHIPSHFTLCNQRQSSPSHRFTSWFISHYRLTVPPTALRWLLYLPAVQALLPSRWFWSPRAACHPVLLGRWVPLLDKSRPTHPAWLGEALLGKPGL